MLPARLPKSPKRSGRWRSSTHLKFVREHFCCVSGCPRTPTEAAHVRRGSDGGMAQKPSDWHAVSLCAGHHAEQHRIGELSFEALYNLDLRELADEFAAKSPKAFEIRQAKKEREGG